MTGWTRDDIDTALGRVLFDAMNYPVPHAVLGRDVSDLREKCADAVWQVIHPDPVDALAAECEQAAHDAIEEAVTTVCETFGVPVPAMDIDAMVGEIDWRQTVRNHMHGLV